MAAAGHPSSGPELIAADGSVPLIQGRTLIQSTFSVTLLTEVPPASTGSASGTALPLSTWRVPSTKPVALPALSRARPKVW